MEDLDNASLQDVLDFHDRFYKPNNAVLAIAGHISLEETLSMVRDYFENIPTGKNPPDVDLSEPTQKSEKRMIWEDKFAPLPGFACSYHIPAYGDRDYYPMEVIERILFDGESSRIYKRLVEHEQCASHVFGGVDSKFGPGTFIFFAQVTPKYVIENVEKFFEEEINKLRSVPVSDTEFQKVINKLKTEFVSKLEKVQFKADQLCKHLVYSDSPEMITKEIEFYLDLTPADIQKAAQKYLKKNNKSVIEVHTVKGTKTF
jgi:predicted Zn-dependent peptidase